MGVVVLVFNHKITSETRNFPFFHHCRNYRSKFKNEETILFCLRVMVGVIILYDHVHPVGAFTKSSNIDVSTGCTYMCVCGGEGGFPALLLSKRLK